MELLVAVLIGVASFAVQLWALRYLFASPCPKCWSKRTHQTDAWENGETWHCRRCGAHWIHRRSRL